MSVLSHSAVDSLPQLKQLETTNESINVVFVDENFEELVWKSYQRGDEQLFTYWSPAVRVGALDTSNFPRLDLPPRADSLGLAIFKLMSSDLRASALDAATFLETFELDENELKELIASYTNDETDRAFKAACTWVTNNEAVWGQWISFPSRKLQGLSICNNHGPCKAGCWVLLGMQLLVSFCLLFLSEKRMLLYGKAQKKFTRLFGKQNKEYRVSSNSHQTDAIANSFKTDQAFLDATETKPVFLYQRSEANFMRKTGDENLVMPPYYPAERWICSFDRRTAYGYLFSQKVLFYQFIYFAGITPCSHDVPPPTGTDDHVRGSARVRINIRGDWNDAVDQTRSRTLAGEPARWDDVWRLDQ